MTWLPYVLLALLLAALVCGFYWLICWLVDDDVVAKTVDTIVERTSQAEELREQQQRLLLAREGKQEKQSPAARFDILIRQSGIKNKLHFMNAGLLVVIAAAGGGGLGFVLYSVTASALVAAVGCGLVPVLVYLILRLQADANYRKAEGELVSFLNLVGNFALTNDDLITIFERITPYLDDPLQTAVSDCCLEARTTGRIHQALQNLTTAIGHEQFSIIIQNLDICSRYTNNITDIVKDCRVMLTQYAAAKKERQSLLANARVEMLIMLVLGGVITYMGSGFADDVSLPALLLGSLPGQLICLYCFALAAYTVKSLFMTDKG